MDRATQWAERPLGIPASEAGDIAATAVSWAWEECKFGREFAEDEGEFWKLVCARLYKTRNSWRSREISLDAPIPGVEGDMDGHDGGWNGYQPPDQFEVCYLNEVKAAIELLPSKHATVMRMIASGHNALDIAEQMKVQISTVFRLLGEARLFIWSRDLIGMAKDNRRALKSDMQIQSDF